jgi:hypothetical protein
VRRNRAIRILLGFGVCMWVLYAIISLDHGRWVWATWLLTLAALQAWAFTKAKYL